MSPAGRGPEVDPRIAERRRSVEGERRRRRGRRLLVVTVSAVVLVGGWLVSRSALFDVDQAEVQGTAHQSPEEVVAASGIEVGDPLLDVDAGAAASRIEALPWIESATVSRSLGGVVTISVTERVPVATAVDEAGGRQLVDGTGRVLGPADGDTAGLTSLEGVTAGPPGETIDGADQALRTFATLGEGVQSRVTSVVAVPDGGLVMTLNPEGVVLWGPPTEIDEKAAALATVMGQVDQRDLASIDVRDPSDPVVRRK